MGRAGHGFFLVSRGGRVRSGMATMHLLLAHASPVLLAKDRLSSGLFSFFQSDAIGIFRLGEHLSRAGPRYKQGGNGKNQDSLLGSSLSSEVPLVV